MTGRTGNRREPRFDKLISQIERSELAQIKPGDGRFAHRGVRTQRVSVPGSALVVKVDPAPAAGSPYSATQWQHIESIARLEPPYQSDQRPPWDPRDVMADLLAGFHGQGLRVLFLVAGQPNRIDIFVGTRLTGSNPAKLAASLDGMSRSIRGSLLAAHEGITTSACDPEDEPLAAALGLLPRCRHLGVLTGIPTRKETEQNQDPPEQLERALKGLYGSQWFYLVQAEPVTAARIESTLSEVFAEIRELSSHLRFTVQQQRTETMSHSAETVNRHAQQYNDQLEMLVEKLQSGQATGMWRTGAYFGSPDAGTVRKALGLFRAVFAGEDSRPQPLRSTILPDQAGALAAISGFQQLLVEMPQGEIQSWSSFNRFAFLTMLPSPDVAVLSHMPSQELPGFGVVPRARFGLAIKQVKHRHPLRIGEVFDSTSGTGNMYEVPLNDLTKHALVCGITGCGKTTTCMGVLVNAWKEFRIPFLVIEPAKSEYRSLTRVLGRDFQTFTLGDETVSPFRLNPFEILPGVHVQTHIDHLRSVFCASFILYSPMPYVLEQCLNEVYEDKGWDLLTSTNALAENPDKVPSLLFPTLSDLYHKVDEVVSRLGYDQRISQDVRAGLKTRIASLRLGGKGSMLDSRVSIPMEALLSRPTVLELKRVGDDEEKAFLIGLLLMRLYEYRERQGDHPQLQHLTLVEEAHRLLAKVSTDTSNVEVANPKGKSVETFCNMLAEIRAYGQGLIIADQIPSKLAIDVVKNTNLKILMRTVAEDDREFLGGAMAMDDAQERQVITLAPGEAIIHAEGLARPILVRTPNFKAEALHDDIVVTNNDVKRQMESFAERNSSAFAPFHGCRSCKAVCDYRGRARRVADNPTFRRVFENYVLSGTLDPGRFVEDYGTLLRVVDPGVGRPGAMRDLEKGFVHCVMTIATEEFSERRRRQYGFSLAGWQKLAQNLTDLLLLINTKFMKVKIKELADNLRKRSEQLSTAYSAQLRQTRGPYEGCSECKQRCLCRSEVARYVWDKNWDKRFRKALDSKDGYEAISAVCDEVARDLCPGVGKAERRVLAVCYAVQQLHFIRLDNPAETLRKIFATGT